MNIQEEAQSISALLLQNRLNEASAKAAALVDQYPEISLAWQSLSEVAEAAKKPLLACKAGLKAVSLSPTDPYALIQLARSYLLMGQSGKALVAGKKALQHKKIKPAALDRLGVALFKCGETELALDCHQQAYDADPGNDHFLRNYAAALYIMGQMEEAERLYRALLQRSPGDYEALASLALVKTVTSENNHISQLKDALSNVRANYVAIKHLLCYALAKELEDIKDYPQSFKYLAQGAELRRSLVDYHEKDMLQAMARLRSLEPSFFSSPSECCENDEAIFIVGMPRSGTTLVEQIISSHSEVFSAGELQNFTLVAQQLVNYVAEENPLDAALMDRLEQADFKQLGDWYIQSTRPRTGHSRYFIDKLPANSLFCGYIHKALPKAKIILLDRHPLDVCYANLKTTFKYGYEYSYQQEETARFYLEWKKLMDYWQKVIPQGCFYKISYEELVANQELESRKLLAFCGLDWQDSCLEFYKGRKGVATASAAQVRKPIYKTSVAKWKHYETQLQPMISILKEGGVEL